MKYAGLVLAAVRGFLLLGLVSWFLFLVREKFIYGEPHISWGFYVATVGGALGGALEIQRGADCCDSEGRRPALTTSPRLQILRSKQQWVKGRKKLRSNDTIRSDQH
jgi:hypothetical protein